MIGLRGLARALSYFTVVPLAGADLGPPDRAAFAWLPWIGAALGTICGGAGWLAWHYLGAPWSFVVPFALAILLTGAIHLDGFLDCCDALFARVEPQRRREILKDPCHGSFALAGMAILAAVWLAALSRFPFGLGPWIAMAAFASVSYHARWLAMVNLDRERRPHDLVCAVTSLPILAALPVSAGAAYAFKKWACTKIGGGESGDIYGALIVVFEVAALCGFAIRP